MGWDMGFLHAWFLTILIETPILIFLFRKEHPIWKLAIAGIIASSATLPFVWFLFPALIPSYLPALAAGELFAFSAEALFYSRFLPALPLCRAAAISLLCNSASFLIGIALWSL